MARHGFEIVERRGFALTPAGAYNRRLDPAGRTAGRRRRRPDAAAGRPSSTDVLYVARRTA